MISLTNVEVLITKDGVLYNYRGVLYTKEQFEDYLAQRKQKGE